MLTAKIISPRHQEPVSSVGMPVRIAHPGRRLGWRQQFSLWCAERLSVGRGRESPGRLDDRWDAPHERVQAPPVENYLIFSHRTSLSVSLVLYTSLS
jgi:hypothetical protein